jgi:hypothetical protein
MPSITVDAKVGRQADEIFSRVRQRKLAGKLGRAVIIATGNNGYIDESDLDSVLKLMGDRDRVVLVTAKGPSVWISKNNRLIRQAAQRNVAGNVRLADWASLAAGHEDWFWADHVHTRPSGSERYAALISRSLR